MVSPHQPGHQSRKKHFWQKLLQRFSEHDTDIAQRRVARQEHVCVYETVARNLSKIIDGAGKGTGGTHGQLQRKQSLSMRCEFARGHVFWWLKTTHQPRNSPVNAGECRYAGGDGGKWPRVYRHCATGRPYDFILMDIADAPIGEEETTRHLREVGELPEFLWLARVPIVAMTANTALEAGMDSHLANPFNPAALNAILEGLS